MEPQIIAIANQKGGVGKTTLAVNLGVYLERQGKRVVVVDADPQGNATSWLLDGDVTQAGMFNLLVVGTPAVRLAQKIDGWNLWLLPGNSRTGEAFIFLSATGKPFTVVADYLRPLATIADYVLIDMPPSKGAGFRETLFAADWVLVPTQLERLSMEGVAYMAQTVADINDEYGRAPRLLGVVPNMTRAYTREHQSQMDQLMQAFGALVWTPIPLSVHVAEACSYGKNLFEFAPGESVTVALEDVGKTLLESLR